MRLISISVLAWLAFTTTLHAQPVLPLPGKSLRFVDLAEVKAEFVPAKARPGEPVTLKLTITPKQDSWTYPFFPPAGQDSKNGITPNKSNPVIFTRPLQDPPGWTEKPSDEPGRTDRVYKKPVTWEFHLVVSPDAKPQSGPLSIRGFSLQVCVPQGCFPSRDVTAPFEILPTTDVIKVPVADEPAVKAHIEGKPLPVVPTAATGQTTPAVKDPPATPNPTPAASKKETQEATSSVLRKMATPVDEYRRQLDDIANQLGERKEERVGGIGTLLLTAAFWGLVSLATPCVFPMIPITVSLFLKQGHQSTSATLKAAGIYCLTIVIVLGFSAFQLLWLFQKLSTSAWMNLFLGGLFVVFALSLFGMYDITLPNSLLRFSEGKRKQGGNIGIVFGAIAFSIVSFTCVAPFLGGFAGMTSSGLYSDIELLLAALTYSGAFAGPFFVLALFPSLMKKLPKSGGWLDSVKAVMGFLEIAAALKFLRTAELRGFGSTSFFTYDLVLAGWVVIAIACGLYLLNIFRLPHDEERPNIAVPRLVFALVFLSFGVHLLPGIFQSGPEKENQRPSGVVYAWVDAFLLPDSGSSGKSQLSWSADLPDAVRAAGERVKKTQESEFIFVDFTGVTCSNCRLNERNIFPQSEVQTSLKRFALVQMYCDSVPAEFYHNPPEISDRNAEAEINEAFQERIFKTMQRPLYAIVEVNVSGRITVHSAYAEGAINDLQGFLAFLKKPFAKG